MGDLTVSEAAAYLGCSVQYVRRMLKEGRIDGRQWKENGPWLIKSKSLEKFKNSRKS